MSARISDGARTVREPAVAGMFYPSSAASLRQMLDDLLETASVSVTTFPKALIAPHAGYVYSGPIAASAFAQLPRRSAIQRVVLLGPSHFVPVPGLALSPHTAFATPLGLVPVDSTMADRARSLPQVQVSERAHGREHSLEVEVPFLQQVLGDFTLLPLVVGDATDEEVGEVIDLLWNGPETLFVVSSDLSHYLDYSSARELDRQTACAIEALCPDDIGHDQACGRVPIRGLLWAARKRGLKAKTLDLRNSGDTAGPRDRVVGYGAFAFSAD